MAPNPTSPPTEDIPHPLKVVPATIDLCPGDAQPFSVDPAGLPVTWTVTPSIGTIDTRGIYTAPPKIPRRRNLVVLAQGQDPTHFATAVITLNDGPQAITFLGWYGVVLAVLIGFGALLSWSLLSTATRVPMVIVNPPVVTLDPQKSETLNFTATVLGDAKNAVTWSTPFGSIDSSGIYKHDAVTDLSKLKAPFAIRATSVSDLNRSGVAIVNLVAGQHFEVLPQAVSASTSQQIPFRMGDGRKVAWSRSRRDLGELSPDGVFTVGGGLTGQDSLQISAVSGTDSRIVAAANIVVNPQFATVNFTDWRLLAFVIIMGSLGSMLYFSSSFVSYVGNGTFHSTWFWFYISRPFVGGGLAVIFFFIVGAGVISGTTYTDLMKVAMISSLVGLFSDKAIKKLSDILDTILATKDDRKDKLTTNTQTQANTAPKINSAVPATVTKGAASTVKFAGANLGNAKVKVNTRDAQIKDASPSGFTVDLTAADTAGDKVTITVTTSEGASTFDLKTV